MYAIVEIAGQQFKVAKDQQVYVHRLAGNEGEKVQFDKVLLLDNNGNVTVGAPAIDGAAVTGKIVQHLKGDKVIVFKKKRRKGYKVKNGHRQALSEITIEEIIEKGAKAASPAKAKASKAAPKPKAEAPAKEEAPKAKAEKPAAKKEAAPKVEEAPAPEAVVETPEVETPADATAEAEEKPKAEAKKEAPAADDTEANDAAEGEEEKSAE